MLTEISFHPLHFLEATAHDTITWLQVRSIPTSGTGLTYASEFIYVQLQRSYMVRSFYITGGFKFVDHLSLGGQPPPILRRTEVATHQQPPHLRICCSLVGQLSLPTSPVLRSVDPPWGPVVAITFTTPDLPTYVQKKLATILSGKSTTPNYKTPSDV